MKKKIIAVLTVAACIFAFAACGQSEEATQTEETTQATEAATEEVSEEMQHQLIINNEPYCVTPDTCDERGYNYLICDSDGTYTFKAVNNDGKDVTWSVYLMDNKFEDETRYISESQEADLEGDGELDIKAGQYIYVYCSENQFSTEDGAKLENTWLEIDYK